MKTHHIKNVSFYLAYDNKVYRLNLKERMEIAGEAIRAPTGASRRGSVWISGLFGRPRRRPNYGLSAHFTERSDIFSKI